VNYYPRHIGDFVSATAHLSMIEDGAYNRLLDWYYQDEKPIPAEKRLIYRRVRAMSKPEQMAVDAVLEEFFRLTDDGYRHTRCDEELERAAMKSGDAVERRANERERQRRHRQRRKELFDALREYGEVPDFETSVTDLETLLSRVTTGATSRNVTRDVTPSATAIANSQEPIANSQTRSKATRGAKSNRAPPEFELTDDMRAWAAAEAPGVDIERETARMRDHEYRTPRSDWPAAWRNWMREAAERQASTGPPRPGANGAQRPPQTEGRYSATIRGLTGRDRQPETIDVESREIPPPPARRLG
jgi:uncharacterized protein YdaU (DUF1376 family)